jgi:hypothetical protein
MKHRLAVWVMLGLCGWVHAEVRRVPGVPPALELLQPLPQDALLAADVGLMVQKLDEIQQALVVVQLGQGDDNPKWVMNQTQLAVLMNKLRDLLQPSDDARAQPPLEDTIWPELAPKEPAYQGVLVVLQTVTGERFAPVRVFAGKVVDPKDTVLVTDPGRFLEYWLFGTARVRRDQMLGANVLPVFTFEQCRLLGQRIVETQPRQCLLPDNNLLLETDERPTLESAKMKTFAQCLNDGEALIYTFPRRCVAAGGRVFTEPPVVWDGDGLVDSQEGDEPDLEQEEKAARKPAEARDETR